MDGFPFKNVVTITNSIFSKIIVCILGLGAIAVSVGPLFIARPVNFLPLIIFSLFSIGATGVFWVKIIPNIIGKIEFHSDRVIEIGPIKQSSNAYSEISGYRKRNNRRSEMLVLFTNDNHKIQTNIKNFNSNEELLKWIYKSFNNLDKIDINNEMKEIVSNNEYGADIKDRIGRLREAKKVAQTINIIFCGAGLWAIFWPEPTIVIMWVMVLLPFMVFAVMKYYRGLIKITPKKETAYAIITPAYIMPIFALAVLGYKTWHIYDWHYFWAPFILIAFLLIIFIFLGLEEIRKYNTTIIGALLICLIFSYGLTISLNGYYLTGIERNYYPVISKKWTITGRSINYYFRLSSWELRPDGEKINVSEETYNRHVVGDKARIIVDNGLFNIICYKVE